MLSATPGATRKAVGLPEPIPRVGSDSEALVLWRATWPLDHHALQGSGGKTVGPSEEGGAVLDRFRVQAPGLEMSVFPEHIPNGDHRPTLYTQWRLRKEK